MGLFLFTYVLLFYGRLLTGLGLPSITNLLPLAIFPLIVIFSLFKNNHRSSYLFFFLCYIFSLLTSSLFNGVSIFNLYIFFSISCAPLAAFILVNNLKQYNLNSVRILVFGTMVLNSFFAIVQSAYVSNTDYVRGLFLGLGNGAHIFTAISCYYVVFIIICPNLLPLSIYHRLKYRIFCVLLFLYPALLSDAKQILLALFLSLPLPFILSFKTQFTFKKVIYTVSPLLLVFVCGNIIINNEQFGYLTWLRQDQLILLGLELKIFVFNIIRLSHTSFLYDILGSGPGTTISRVALMLPDYQTLLDSDWVTISPLTNQILNFQESNYVTNTSTGSSMFSLTFSIAAFYGDIGLFGLFSYLGFIIALIIFICRSNSFHSSFTLSYFLSLGLIYQYWEEPIFSFFIFMILYLASQGRSLIPIHSYSPKVFGRAK